MIICKITNKPSYLLNNKHRDCERDRFNYYKILSYNSRNYTNHLIYEWNTCKNRIQNRKLWR